MMRHAASAFSDPRGQFIRGEAHLLAQLGGPGLVGIGAGQIQGARVGKNPCRGATQASDRPRSCRVFREQAAGLGGVPDAGATASPTLGVMSSELARAAYETLEPYHVLAYFNPYAGAAARRAGLDELGLYVGARGAPLGRCPSAVVTATFANFTPAYVHHGWSGALSVGLPAAEAARTEALDHALRDALGERIDAPELRTIVGAVRVGIVEAPYAGRPLAAAWAAHPWPDEPHLQLWHAISVVREHRGDGHLAALTLAGLTPVETLVLHEAPHPNPAVRRRTMGKKGLLRTRGWTEDDWDAASESLREKGILDAEGAMTAAGSGLYDRLEAQTDAAAATLWAAVPEADETLRLARPFVKAVIDIGYLPGTKPRATTPD